MKRVCIHQPDFLPYLGFFQRLVHTDLFILLDDVQFIRSGWQNRDQLKTPRGAQWLSVPINKQDLFKPIREIRLAPDAERWVPVTLNLIRENYRKAPYFDRYFPEIEATFRHGHQTLYGLNRAFLDRCFEWFDLSIETVLASQFGIQETKNQRLVQLIKAVQGTHYLSGQGSKAYLDEALFSANDITVEWQQFEPPVYPQLNGPFIPNLSCLDAVMNCGPHAKDLIRP